MPSLTAVRAVNDGMSLAGTRSLVVGGTSGIGLGIAKKLCALGSEVTIVGRNRANAEAAVSEIRSSIPAGGPGKVDFQLADMSLVKEAAVLGGNFAKTVDRLDYLVITAGIMKVQGRVETAEGLDEKMATHYYARMGLARSLIPLLEKTASKNRDVRVLNVLSSCHGRMPPDITDLDLKRTFSMRNCHDATTFYSDLAAESLQKEAPQVSQIHAHPGIVNTQIGRNLPFFFRWPLQLLSPFVLTSVDECGEYMTHLLLSPKFKGGWFLANEKAERLEPLKHHTEENRSLVWGHTVSLLKELLN